MTWANKDCYLRYGHLFSNFLCLRTLFINIYGKCVWIKLSNRVVWWIGKMNWSLRGGGKRAYPLSLTRSTSTSFYTRWSAYVILIIPKDLNIYQSCITDPSPETCCRLSARADLEKRLPPRPEEDRRLGLSWPPEVNAAGVNIPEVGVTCPPPVSDVKPDREPPIERGAGCRFRFAITSTYRTKLQSTRIIDLKVSHWWTKL